jgi:hypothetical protein
MLTPTRTPQITPPRSLHPVAAKHKRRLQLPVFYQVGAVQRVEDPRGAKARAQAGGAQRARGLGVDGADELAQGRDGAAAVGGGDLGAWASAVRIQYSRVRCSVCQLCCSSDSYTQTRTQDTTHKHTYNPPPPPPPAPR